MASRIAAARSASPAALGAALPRQRDQLTQQQRLLVAVGLTLGQLESRDELGPSLGQAAGARVQAAGEPVHAHLQAVQ